MSNKDKETQKEEKGQIVCPFGRFFMELCFSKDSRFFEHITRSKIELLKAIRAIIDEKIEHLEKKIKPEKKVTKIEVE